MASFAQSELSSALAEVPWGYRSSALLPAASSGEARAKVELLEDGQSLVVSCREGGWSVVETSGGCPQPSSIFETLDDLFLAVSPLFASTRMHKLLEKLTAVADERNNDTASGSPPN
ncbi:hypothetical protein JCM10207_000600 [Rhodosporidiobolus poonsookiae]